MSKAATTKPRLEVTSRCLNEDITAHVIGWTSEPVKSMSSTQSQIPVTSLDGYRAAADTVESWLRLVDKNRPRRLKKGYRKSAAYREGYWQALMFAHCLHAMGEYPLSNAAAIRAYLAKQPTQKDIDNA